ncbi:hypothetical protein BRADI_4g18245v3 [Brachypodium distachyon]|uniref:Uncharacterized protein n=1 Tax=Brachypodium distachyon TaxID=15368 RepID=A0A0Q3IQC4_BRADI|nr:hypothetical protein BRADI_4g18245v3 [Brachypodium distachyon]
MSLRRYVNLVISNHTIDASTIRRTASRATNSSTHQKKQQRREICPDYEKCRQMYLLAGAAEGRKNSRSRSRRRRVSGRRRQSSASNHRKIFFIDSKARTGLYDTEARHMITVPCLHEPKRNPIALSTPSSPGPEGEQEQDQEQDGGDLSLYIMDMMHSPRNPALFEALVCHKCRGQHAPVEETWHRETLPLPPFYDHTIDQHTFVLSYDVVGRVICVSVSVSTPSGSMTVRSGSTYCFDTVSQMWSLAGDWEMPFHGKAEYVLELKLWFGVSADNGQLYVQPTSLCLG